MTYEEAFEWCWERDATLSFHEVRGEKRVRVRTARGEPQAERDTVLRAIEAAAKMGASPLDVLGMAELRYVAKTAVQLMGAYLVLPSRNGQDLKDIRCSLFNVLRDFGITEGTAAAAFEELE